MMLEDVGLKEFGLRACSVMLNRRLIRHLSRSLGFRFQRLEGGQADFGDPGFTAAGLDVKRDLD